MLSTTLLSQRMAKRNGQMLFASKQTLGIELFIEAKHIALVSYKNMEYQECMMELYDGIKKATGPYLKKSAPMKQKTRYIIH